MLGWQFVWGVSQLINNGISSRCFLSAANYGELSYDGTSGKLLNRIAHKFPGNLIFHLMLLRFLRTLNLVVGLLSTYSLLICPLFLTDSHRCLK